jgi:FAD/FMN-containing dehydrogenase
VIQDILIPIENALPFYHFMWSSIGISPIWICPFQFYEAKARYSLCPQLGATTLYLDFGFWDILPSHQPKGFFNQLIEKKSSELNGFKSLYSDSFYTEEEFWDMYPKSDFTALKKKYDPKNVFKDLYDKCVRRR